MKILNKQVHKLQKDILSKPKISALLGKLKEYSLETYEHSLRVGLLSLDLGFENGLNHGHLQILGRAALLHDVGKIKIDSRILHKEGKLTPLEKEEIDRHVRGSIKLVEKESMNFVKKIVAQHHEFKSKPYPRSGNNRRKTKRDLERRADFSTDIKTIRMLGEILALCDMFDALISTRSYKEKLSPKTVFKILEREFTGNKELLNQLQKRI